MSVNQLIDLSEYKKRYKKVGHGIYVKKTNLPAQDNAKSDENEIKLVVLKNRSTPNKGTIHYHL